MIALASQSLLQAHHFFNYLHDDELVFAVEMIKVVVVLNFNITLILIIYLCFLLFLIFLVTFFSCFSWPSDTSDEYYEILRLTHHLVAIGLEHRFKQLLAVHLPRPYRTRPVGIPDMSGMCWQTISHALLALLALA